MLAILSLIAILDPKQHVFSRALGLIAFGAIFDEATTKLGPDQLAGVQAHVALKLQLGGGAQALGRARIARNKDDLAIFRGFSGPSKMGWGFDRCPIFIGTQESAIQIVAGEIEIVRVAAKEAHGIFGREHQTHVFISAVFVDFILTATEQGNHVATEQFLIVILARFFFQLGNCYAARLGDFAGLNACRCSFHLSGVVDDADQHFCFHAGASLLVGQSSGQKAVQAVILIGARQIGHTAGHAMPIGQDQTTIGNKTGRTA